jgi:hypothetical protein
MNGREHGAMADAAGHTVLARLQALQAAPEPLAALLADLRGIEHGGDPRFTMTLDHYLQSWLGSQPREVFRLAGPRLLILTPADAGPLLDAGAKALGHTLLSHGFGTLHVTRYDMATEGERLFADLFPNDATAALREAAERAPTAALAHLLEVERVLHGADIDSIVREQPVWSFSADRPTVVTTELAVSLEELESRLSLSLRRDSWLRHEVAVRLDRGLLRHVARDRSHDPHPSPSTCTPPPCWTTASTNWHARSKRRCVRGSPPSFPAGNSPSPRHRWSRRPDA